jgi:hypothetical protein
MSFFPALLPGRVLFITYFNYLIMSTLIVAAILIVSTVLISLIFISINNKNERKRNEKLLTLFSEAGSTHGLSFSSQEVLRNKIIGLDGLKRALLVFEFALVESVIYINMAEIKNCTVTKEYESVNIGTEKKNNIEKRLTSIGIRFDFMNGAKPVSISFYESDFNSVYETAELEAKAKDWVAVLSKMIVKEQKAIA